MIYDGFDFSKLLRVESIDRPLMPRVDVDSESIDGADGERVNSVTLKAMTVDVKVRLVRPFEDMGRRQGLEGMRRLLSGRLLRREPRKLTLDDAPDTYLMAVLSGDTDLDRIVTTHTATLSWYCADPVSYGREGRRSATGRARVNVGGSYPTAPVVSVDVPGSTYTVTVDGKTMRALGTTEGDAPLVFDCAAHLVSKGGTPVKLDVRDDFATWEPGIHVVECADPFTVTWRERWL